MPHVTGTAVAFATFGDAARCSHGAAVNRCPPAHADSDRRHSRSAVRDLSRWRRTLVTVRRGMPLPQTPGVVEPRRTGNRGARLPPSRTRARRSDALREPSRADSAYLRRTRAQVELAAAARRRAAAGNERRCRPSPSPTGSAKRRRAPAENLDARRRHCSTPRTRRNGWPVTPPRRMPSPRRPARCLTTPTIRTSSTGRRCRSAYGARPRPARGVARRAAGRAFARRAAGQPVSPLGARSISLPICTLTLKQPQSALEASLLAYRFGEAAPAHRRW